MNQEQQTKYKRLNERLQELEKLNRDIAKLAFYINENPITADEEYLLMKQLGHMSNYRDTLTLRISKGVY